MKLNLGWALTLLLAACGTRANPDYEVGDGGDADADVDVDADTDADADSDGDTDADTDTDSGTGTGTGTESVTDTDTRTEEPCGKGLTRCEGECFDTNTEEKHCGGCGNECTVAEGNACFGGECFCGDADACDGTRSNSCCAEESNCRDFTSDESNCGACGNECGSNQVCDDGDCVCDECATADDCSGSCEMGWTCVRLGEADCGECLCGISGAD